MPGNDNRKDISQAFLEMSEAEWDDLVKRGIAQHLVNLIPLAVAFQDDLEDAKKFFIEVKELALPPKIDQQLDLIDKIRVGITTTVQDPNLEPFEINEVLDSALDGLKKAYTKYTKLESDTVYTIKSNSKRLPKKEAFVEKVRSYWNYIDDFWPSEREALLGKWNQYFAETDAALQGASDELRVATVTSPHGVLIQVSNLLKKRSAAFTAQKAADSLERIKQYYVEELGLIPAYMGAQGNWKVERDDCPEKRLPEVHTKLSDRFAFCRFENKKCPSFEWSQGSYVKCKSFVRLKEASLIEEIRVLADKNYLNQLQEIAETDPFVKMLFVEADRRSGELFYGKVIDDRLEKMLEQYPTSNRRGAFKYRVYMIANEPVLVSGKYAVAADKILLETIGEGERMPKQASTVRVAGPVMRVTFTSNALRDPEFRDFLRKKNARKSKHCTYDVPFDRDEDISFFLSEVRDEFNYKIEVFQIMEDADEFVEKDFGVYRFSDLPLSRFSSFGRTLSYLPPVKNPPKNISANALSVLGAEKLVDVANNLPENHPLRSKVAGLADRLRVGAHILIATEEDVIRYADGAIGIVPEPGARWMERDPDTGAAALVEMVEVVRPKQGAPVYKVRRLDTGKEIELRQSLSKDACPPPPDGGNMALPPPPPPAPESPFGHIIGEDDVYYIVQIPKSPGMQGPGGFEPPPFGRFPGDEPPLPPPGAALPFVSPGGNLAPPAPPVSGLPPAVDQGPVVEQEGVFVVNDRPLTNPDATKPEQPDFAEEQLVEEIRKQTKPGLKFLNAPARSPVAPSGATPAEIDEAVEKLRSMFKGDPRVKDIRRDLSPQGKPVLYLHCTMPRAMKDEVPDSVNGFSVVLAPLHDSLTKEIDSESLSAEPSDTTADSLVNPMPNRPENGKSKGRDFPPGPYLDQVSGPPSMNDSLVTQIRDIPKGR
jgi:hypothetical protein